MAKQLYRSNTDKVISGVCGGLGEYFGINSVIIRIVVLVLFFSWGIGLVPYIIAALIIPKRPKTLYEEDVRHVPSDDFNRVDW